MPLSVETIRLLLGTAAVMALLAVAHGVVARAVRSPGRLSLVMGLLFGAGAAWTMLDPVEIRPGVQADLRSLPLTLAGAFLGWRGTAAAVLVAAATRAGIGGVGAVTGVVAIATSAASGLAWARLAGRARRGGPGPARAGGGGMGGGGMGETEAGRDRRGLPTVLGLAGLSLAHLLPTFILPWDIALSLVRGVWPVVAPAHVLGVVLVATLLEREQALAETARRLGLAALRDPLTGLLNRRGFEAAVAERRPEFTGSALLLVDLDHFKRVNDLHGHAAGDAVLAEVGPRLEAALGGRGVLGRMGGEELAVFLPSILPRETALVADRLRLAVGARPFATPAGSLAVTASVGAAWSAGPADLDALGHKADLALYAAKGAGRDRCRLAAARPEAVLRLARLPPDTLAA